MIIKFVKFFGIFINVIVVFNCHFGIAKGAKNGNEPSFLQMFHETHKKGTEFATPEIAEKICMYSLLNLYNFLWIVKIINIIGFSFSKMKSEMSWRKILLFSKWKFAKICQIAIVFVCCAGFYLCVIQF